MPTVKLTKTAVESFIPEARDAYLWDSALPRFGARVTPAGSRIYLVQYRAKGTPGEPLKTRRITIGAHGRPWTVEKARDQARTFLAQVDLGQDPFADRIAATKARAAANAAEIEAEMQAQARQRNTFSAMAERYVALRAKRDRSWQETERLLRHGPMVTWGQRHIAEIRRSDVADLVDAISTRSPAVGRATYAVLRPLFAWCLERDLIERSPCEGMRAPPRPAARERVLSDNELRLVWLGSLELGEPFGPLVQMLILTGQRRAEVAGMRWSELDLQRASWAIPGARTKNKLDHEIDLSDQALDVLASKVTKAGDLLFPARGEGAARGFSAVKRRLDARVLERLRAEEGSEAASLPEWRLHDLRRTAATGMAALGSQPHVTERVLNHVSGVAGGLIGVYQRHTYRPERKAALAAWGARVATIVQGRTIVTDVVSIRA